MHTFIETVLTIILAIDNQYKLSIKLSIININLYL